MSCRRRRRIAEQDGSGDSAAGSRRAEPISNRRSTRVDPVKESRAKISRRADPTPDGNLSVFTSRADGVVDLTLELGHGSLEK